MAKSVGGNKEWGDYYRIFSNCRKKTDSEFNLKPKSNNNYDRPWKYSIILTP
jgi:hypothetical protein